MAVFVKEYDWMWLSTGLNLSPVECRIYAYIYGLTESKTAKTKGYNGSTRQLSRTLGLSLGMASIALRSLQDEQLIIRKDGVYLTVQPLNEGVQSMNGSVQPLNENVQSMNESVQSLNPHTPIYINKEKREEYNASCDRIAQTNPSNPSSFVKPLSSNQSALTQPTSFDLLLNAFKSHNANINPSPEILANSRRLWDDLPDFKQQQLLQAIQNGSWNKSRLDWTISDFHFREPTNYAGQPMPASFSYYRAEFNGARGIYTKKDVEDFHMIKPEHFIDL